MKYLLLVLVVFFTGCGNSANILVSTGKKPPAFFSVYDKKTMDNFVFDTEKFSFIFPVSKQRDFIENERWYGVSTRDGHTISFGMGPYSVAISTSYLSREYGEGDRALENGTLIFSPQRTKPDGHIINIDTHIEHHGKEKYPCVVSQSERHYKKYGTTYRKGYRCYKFNPTRTKSKQVSVTLTYNKPKDPQLAKEYTYEDLKRRAGRMLDSLYIKDGW
ncbi:MAG: hypothetical protein ABXS91_07870 [Sulfurimonas sp.]